MSNSRQLIQLIKQELRTRGIHYQALAKALGLSESAIKQMFSSGNISLKRLDAICEVLKLDYADLLGKLQDNAPKMDRLSFGQEKELITGLRLLLVAYCMVNFWSFEAILKRYKFSETELIRYLARLNKMKLIELLPDNRVRPLVSIHLIDSLHRNTILIPVDMQIL